MSKKNLAYFMREEVKTEEIVEVPGPSTIKDENGNVIMFQIKKLKMDKINEIFNSYKKSEVYMDRKKRQPYVDNGKVVMIESTDNTKAFRHLVVEAVVYPDMHDSELMNFYDCVDVTDMPVKMFTSDEYAEVSRIVSDVLGLGGASEDDDDDDLKEAKN